ncbi:post-GPI attachment to proteins factor 3 isoform X2 [Achroia grisella]|uniref:post-GPI attachment to proteins factor 3 isoform X2 n=1 Tax=Achroia grisella TaxID=688607 RepID=UPI0027D2A537|nr:post-GPI attachment to proteins factor 3 isoform X2 [Achroia grisella]
MYFRTLTIFIIISKFSGILSSNGDRSPFYQNCLKTCRKANCTDDGRSFKSAALKQQDVWCQLLQWSCREDCQYHCMWKTVDGFQERGYRIPKFHGKWPFVRFFGVQEPASAFASLLNLATHIYMHNEITKKFSVKSTPLVLFWHGFATVCMNAWTWSTIFHTRDTPFTEFMDYACALSMVMSLFIAAIVRRKKFAAALLALPTLYYVEHVRYLYSGRIDYDYNMNVNVFFGVVGSVTWLVWAGGMLVAGRKHAWRVAVFTIASGAALSLELLDFPPKRSWDAHALWHLSTAPLPLLFYRFVIDDLYYLQNSKIRDKNYLKQT